MKKNCVLVFTALASLSLHAADTKTEPVPVHKANYELAQHWTAPKVGKLVFDTSVTPHWLDNGDRFWYSYETSSGRSFYLVDPVKKTKAPLFDNAKIAAMLTEITRTPYDAHHLPIRTIKFAKNDSIVEFELRVDKDADMNGKQTATETEEQTQTTDGHNGTPQRQAGAGRDTAQRTHPDPVLRI